MLMKFRSLYNSTKKKTLWFFYRGVTAFREVPLTPPPPPCFPSRNITEKAETHAPAMRHVIIG